MTTMNVETAKANAMNVETAKANAIESLEMLINAAETEVFVKCKTGEIDSPKDLTSAFREFLNYRAKIFHMIAILEQGEKVKDKKG